MKISSQLSPLNFKGATISINALSDTHGHLQLTDRAYQALAQNKDDVFEKEEKGHKNILIIGGDWFISGGKKGFLTNPNMPLMKFQARMLNKFIRKIKESFPLIESFFVVGNHELDGGVKLFSETMKEIDADVIMSNLDTEKSSALYSAIEEGKVVTSRTVFVSDDKKQDVEYPILSLGVCPINLSYYQPELDGISLIDNVNMAQKLVKKEDYTKTFAAIKGQVDEFREKYPDGVVVLTCHTGVDFADNCAEAKLADVIFDAHEHKDGTRIVNGIPIVALSQNFEKIVNTKITLDDNGRKKRIDFKEIRPNLIDYEAGELEEFYEELFKKDTKKLYTVKSTDDSLKELSTKNVRGQNSHLANFITDCILKEIKRYDDSVQIFAINASSIRSGFKLTDGANISPIEISSCLDGISPEQADIFVTSVTGRKLVEMILDNFLFNIKDTEKNPLIHYSGLEIDKTGLLKAHSLGKFGSELCKYIKLKETNKPIDPDETYKIANPEKYFIKTRNEKIKSLKDKSYPLNKNVHDLFKDYFKNNKETVFTPETRLF